jgi:hypothetical protein
MHQAFEKAINELLPRLALDRPRAGADRVWPGLTGRLRDAPQVLGFAPHTTTVMLLSPGVAAVRWVGDDVTAGLFVSSAGGEALRRGLVLAALLTTHAPASILQPGDATLGDGSFTIAGHLVYFARGNLGAMVRSENPQRPAGDLARQLDAAIQQEATVAPWALAGLLPRITALDVARAEVVVGATVRATLRIDPAWAGRARAHFDFSTEYLTAEYPEDHVADLTGVAPGDAQVFGCAVDQATLLCASQRAAITVKPGPPMAAPGQGEDA